MTFDEWALKDRPTYKPTDDSVECRRLRRCWAAASADVEMLQGLLLWVLWHRQGPDGLSIRRPICAALGLDATAELTAEQIRCGTDAAADAMRGAA